MKLTVYHYPQCGTCRKAIKWLKGQGKDFEPVHIVDHPPTEEQLADWIRKSGLEVKKFFNTSGAVYKEMNLKEKLPTMSEEEQIKLLASNGKLIKRPIITDGEKVTVGFRENETTQVWS